MRRDEHLTKQSIARVLGPISDSEAAELVAAGATEEELIEAHAWVTNGEALVSQMRPPPTGRIAKLIGMLDRLEGPHTTED